MVDSAHAALVSAGIQPSSPEHIADTLSRNFVDRKLLRKKYIKYYD
jgi:hypothetical protein